MHRRNVMISPVGSNFTFNRAADSMIVVDSFALADAQQLGFTTTVELALHAEWQLEHCRSMFTLFKAKQVAGEQMGFDRDDGARAVALLELREELIYKTIKALSDPKPVEAVGSIGDCCIERKILLL